MFIEQPACFLRWLYPRAQWRMNPKERVVYLTFDDGPIPEATPFILSVLERYNVQATFFMVGDNVQKYPHLLAEVKKRGHAIGNHTYNHIGGFRWSPGRYIENVYKADELLHTRLFRPPHGWMHWIPYGYLLHQGFKVVMWDVVTRDYSRLLTAEEVLQNVKRYTRNGSIITFHDSLKSIDKLKHCLPEAIQWLLAEGYEFRTL